MAVTSDGGKNGRGRGRARGARMDEGEGEEAETRNEMRGSEKTVAVQRACESLHSRRSHRKEGDMRLWLPSIFSLILLLTRSRARYLYYNGYSMRKVSKKENKIKRTFKPATGCTASYGSGKRCRNFTELSRRVRRRAQGNGNEEWCGGNRCQPLSLMEKMKNERRVN